MKTTITILCENAVPVPAPFRVIGEHGFAAYIETEAGNVLFDTGQGIGIVQNAMALKKDLGAISAILLSHGHYDHTGGLDKVLLINGRTDVYAHPDLFSRHFSERKGVKKFIGIPHRRAFLETLGANFMLSRELQEITKDLYLTGEIERTNEFEKLDDTMFVQGENGEIIRPDPLRDDLSLIVRTEKGLIVLLGCAHAGMINILDYVVKQLPGEKIYAVVGGTHLGFAGDRQFDETLKRIEAYKIEKVGVSHCTGLLNASRLQAHLKDRFFFGNVGISIEV